MPVLNNPARFGILFLWSFAGFAVGAASFYCYGDEKVTSGTSGRKGVADTAVEKKPVENRSTTKASTESQPDSVVSNALVSNADDPPLLDLTELLMILGELPSLSDDPASHEVARTCESASQPLTVKLTSSGDEPADGIVTDPSNQPLVINPLRASTPSERTVANAPTAKTPSAKTPSAKTPSLETTTSSTATKQPLPIGKSTEQPLQLPIDPKAIDPKPTEQNPTAQKSATDVITSQPSKAQSSGPKSVADQAEAPLVIGSPGPSTQLSSDPPTLVMEDKDNGKQPASNAPANTASNELAMLDEQSENSALMKDSAKESGSESVAETMQEVSEEPASIAEKLAELLIVPSTPNNDTNNDMESDTNKETNSSTSKPKRKLVAVKVLTEQDQEAPNLQDTPREIDSKQARDEDENAAVAKRPQASKKSFVESPSDLSSSAPTEKAVILPKSSPAKIETALSPAEVRRKQRVESCLSYYIANLETVVERSPWAVMHAMLPFGVEGEIIVGNKRVNSIQWMCYNGTCRTQKMFTPSGRSFRPNVGGGVQGHEGQFLAMLAQSQVGADYPIVVANKRYSVLDLVRYEMATCKEKTELTFKLMALSYYVDTNQAWTAMDRRKWNIEKLVAEELAQPVVGAACGGTHRLMALTFALRQRKAEGRPIDGHYARADKFIADYIDYTWTLQNPDGSFSSNWFESRGHEQNKERLVQTTGHILEWLMFTLPKDKLEDPRVLKSVDFLLNNIWDDRTHKWPIGPRGHATRAVALYQQRVYGVQPGQRHTEMASTIDALKRRR
ncbi:MAG: hypothetical protein NTW52_19755 [Planctomycetota bacterium]|nr:hypothetical protein [Planctomycetota bacterium]